MIGYKRWTCWLVGLTAALLLAMGCAKPDPNPTKKENAHGHHEHPDAGPHDGALVEWGEEEYHAEFTVDHAKKEAVVYVLDGTGKKAPSVKPEDITEVKLILKNVTPPLTLDLKFDPSRSDLKGLAFTGTHDKLGVVMEFKGEISGKVSGKPYVGDFEEKAHDHMHEKK